jgi:hypothetical protein
VEAVVVALEHRDGAEPMGEHEKLSTQQVGRGQEKTPLVGKSAGGKTSWQTD